MIPVDQQQDPRNDIGPIYKAIGGLALIGAFLVIGIQAVNGQHIGSNDVILVGICSLLCLALWRPEKFDVIIKAVADHLPSLSFTKREVTPHESQEYEARRDD